MVGGASPIGVLNLGRAEGLAARAVRRVIPPLPAEAKPAPATPGHTASIVALAPASMAALIEAQEQLADHAPVLSRANMADKIDALIARLADDIPPPPADGSLTVRRLETARHRLTLR